MGRPKTKARGKSAKIGRTEKAPEWLPRLSNERDEQILGAAYDVFVAKGYHRATMLEIATAARASKETLYARFGSKERLFEALMAWGASARQPGLRALAEASPERAEEALREAAQELLLLFYRPESIALARLLAAEGALRPELARITEEVAVRPVRETLTNFYVRLVAAGVMPAEDAPASAETFIDVVRGVSLERVVSGQDPPPDARRIAEIAVRAARVAIHAFATRRDG
jgi:AcrR family transcriptional regulator